MLSTKKRRLLTATGLSTAAAADVYDVTCDVAVSSLSASDAAAFLKHDHIFPTRDPEIGRAVPDEANTPRIGGINKPPPDRGVGTLGCASGGGNG